MNADTEALFEQALKHVLDESAKLLKRKDVVQVLPVIVALNNLASETHKVRSAGLHRLKSVNTLIARAKSVERICDKISLKLWRYIPVSVSAVYQKVGSSLRSRPDERGAAAELRSHYDKIRIRLLQQALGAKVLANNNDKGNEIEKVWQQFLQKALGESVRVLVGGIIYDYHGKISRHQIDLIVVPSEALVTFPSGADDGKVHVPVDQVISAIMVTSNLTATKLYEDWEKLIAIPEYTERGEASDHPHLKDQPWPLRYIVGAQSDPIEALRAAWLKAAENLKGPGPEFVVTLDSGYLFSGATKWPRPRYPRKGIDDVRSEDGVFRGLGLAWLLLQHRGRLACIHRRALGPINRQADSLYKAGLKDAMPSTWSPRFHTMLQSNEVAGILEWGFADRLVHNHLHLTGLNRKGQRSLLLDGFEYSPAKPLDTTNFRWFRYGAKCHSGDLVALEEWLESASQKNHCTRIAVFNSITGEEVKGAEIDALHTISDIEKLGISAK